jgi:signal transduction histidine kinase
MEKAHSSLLSMINAGVSHEMRNPLNSIIAQNIEKGNVYQQLKAAVDDYRQGKIDHENFLSQHD